MFALEQCPWTFAAQMDLKRSSIFKSHWPLPSPPPSQRLQLQPGSWPGVFGFDRHQDSGPADVPGGGRPSRPVHQPHVELRRPERASAWRRQSQQTHLLPGLPQHGSGLPGLQQPQCCQAAGSALHAGTRSLLSDPLPYPGGSFTAGWKLFCWFLFGFVFAALFYLLRTLGWCFHFINSLMTFILIVMVNSCCSNFRELFTMTWIPYKNSISTVNCSYSFSHLLCSLFKYRENVKKTFYCCFSSIISSALLFKDKNENRNEQQRNKSTGLRLIHNQTLVLLCKHQNKMQNNTKWSRLKVRQWTDPVEVIRRSTKLTDLPPEPSVLHVHEPMKQTRSVFVSCVATIEPAPSPEPDLGRHRHEPDHRGRPHPEEVPAQLPQGRGRGEQAGHLPKLRGDAGPGGAAGRQRSQTAAGVRQGRRGEKRFIKHKRTTRHAHTDCVAVCSHMITTLCCGSRSHITVLHTRQTSSSTINIWHKMFFIKTPTWLRTGHLNGVTQVHQLLWTWELFDGYWFIVVITK